MGGRVGQKCNKNDVDEIYPRFLTIPVMGSITWCCCLKVQVLGGYDEVIRLSFSVYSDEYLIFRYC